MKDRSFEHALAVGAVILCGVLHSGCTPAAQQTATAIANGVEVLCIAVASVEAPAAEPICVGADELAKIAIAWAAAHGGAQPTITMAPSGVAIVPADMHAALAALPSVKARKLSKKACAPGSVAP